MRPFPPLPAGGSRRRGLGAVALGLALLAPGAAPLAARGATPVADVDSLPRARASWSEVFAGETDTVAFIGSEGSLLRAPFHLATVETLWATRGGERLVRLRAAPQGGEVAWITRPADGDTSRLWIGRERPRQARVRFFALVSHPLGILRFEPGVPTLEDPDFQGARFVAPSAFMRRFSTHTLEWMPDGSGVVFGTQDGIALAAPEGGRAREVSAVLALDLLALDPAAIFLVDAVVQGAGGRREDWLLLYPDRERWRLFTASGLRRAASWTASTTDVWWSHGRTIRSIHAHSPVPEDEIQAEADVIWLEHDRIRGALAWASGRKLQRRLEPGGSPETLAEMPAPIEAVLAAPGTVTRGLLAGSRLGIWRLGGDSLRILALGGLRPTSMLELAGGDLILIAGTPGDATGIARVRGGADALEAIPMPRGKHLAIAMTPGRRMLVAAEAGSDPPRTFHVYDPERGQWTEVENPGLTGWELLSRR